MVRFEDERGWESLEYPDECRDVLFEFLMSVKDSIERNDEWTLVWINKRKIMKAFEGMMWKYSADPNVVACLGHFVWSIKDWDRVDYGGV